MGASQADQSDELGVAAFCLMAVLAICGRLAWVGVVTTEDGIQVKNFFSNFFLEWSDIEKFEVGWWWFAEVCVIRTVDGERKLATAIYEGGLRPNGSAKETAMALNLELQAALGRASRY